MLENNDNDYVQVLSGINLKIKREQLVGFLGKIGSGKTSLINSLFGETITLARRKPKITIAGETSLVS